MKRQTREQLVFEENKKLKLVEQSVIKAVQKSQAIPIKNDWNERPYFAAYNNKVIDDID